MSAVKCTSGSIRMFVALGCLVLTSTSVYAEGTGLPLARAADVALGGRTTRMDYASQDPARHLLFIAHLGDSAVIVFDTRAQRVKARIPNISHVHGVLVIPELGRVYASATGTNEVVAIDESSLQIAARIPGGTYPDGMAYAPEVRKLYVSDEHGDTDTVIDVRTETRVATIQLGGEVGNTQYDAGSKHIFVNVQTRGQLAEIDPTTDTVIGRITLPGAQGNHGLLVEPTQRRAFVACEGNDRLLVVNLETRKVTRAFSSIKDPDVLAYDPGLGLIYVAGESGWVYLFRLTEGKVAELAGGLLGPNAHVVSIDPSTHYAYFPLMDLDGATALRVMRPTPCAQANHRC